MYHCHTVSGRTVWEGTRDADTRGGGLNGVVKRGLMDGQQGFLYRSQTYKLLKCTHIQTVQQLIAWYYKH